MTQKHPKLTTLMQVGMGKNQQTTDMAARLCLGLIFLNFSILSSVEDHAGRMFL
jgi:hypothetical protein